MAVPNSSPESRTQDPTCIERRIPIPVAGPRCEDFWGPLDASSVSWHGSLSLLARSGEPCRPDLHRDLPLNTSGLLEVLTHHFGRPAAPGPESPLPWRQSRVDLRPGQATP